MGFEQMSIKTNGLWTNAPSTNVWEPEKISDKNCAPDNWTIAK